MDTFAPNTDADKESYQGPVSPIPTSADGVFLSENLPETAKHMHNAAIIRTMMQASGAHMQGTYLMHTSYQMLELFHTQPLAVDSQNVRPYQFDHSDEHCDQWTNWKFRFSESKYGPLPIGNPNAGLANSKAADYLDQTRFDGRLAMAQKMNASFLGTYDQKQFVHTPIFIMMRSN